MSTVLGIDVETTGLDSATDRITEIGAVLLDWDTGTPLQMLSSLVIPQCPISQEITELTGITDEMVEKYGSWEEDVLAELVCMVEKADYLMAHNAAFDKGFILAACVRREITIPDKDWLCSREDIKYDKSIQSRHLKYLAAEHNFCNPFSHRAIFDVLTMLKVAENYSLANIIARSKEPTVFVQAHVTFDEQELAKEKGYGWCGPKKTWWKKMKSSDYEAEKQEYGFRTSIMAGSPE